jgi:hypothetical protein
MSKRLALSLHAAARREFLRSTALPGMASLFQQR